MREELPEPFSCETAAQGDRLEVRPVGEIDVATARELQAALTAAIEQRPAALRLDLSRVTFMDSSGLRVVLTSDADARREGVPLEIVPGPSAVQRVFEVAGLADHLRFAA